MVHVPVRRTHSVSAVGRVTSSVPSGCVTGVVASMQGTSPHCSPNLGTIVGSRHHPARIDRAASSIVPLAYSIPYKEEAWLCHYRRIAWLIARLLIVRKLPGPIMPG